MKKLMKDEPMKFSIPMYLSLLHPSEDGIQPSAEWGLLYMCVYEYAEKQLHTGNLT